MAPHPHRNDQWNAEHPEVRTRLSLRDRSRLHRILIARHQHLHDFLLDAIAWAEAQRPANTQIFRVNFPEEFADLGAQETARRVEDFLALAHGAARSGDAIDAIQFRRAAGRYQDATSFFQSVQALYARSRRSTTPASDNTPPSTES